jgi:hypothetical protein
MFDSIAKKVSVDSKGNKIKHDRRVSLQLHSMAGRVGLKVSEYIKAGKLKRIKPVSYASNDAGYWNVHALMDAVEKGTKLYVTTRKGTKTAPQAFTVIRRFGLVDGAGNTPRSVAQLRNGVYTSSRYPNVVVRVDSTPHSMHPGFIKDSMAQVFSPKKKPQVVASATPKTKVAPSGKEVKV